MFFFSDTIRNLELKILSVESNVLALLQIVRANTASLGTGLNRGTAERAAISAAEAQEVIDVETALGLQLNTTADLLAAGERIQNDSRLRQQLVSNIL